MYIYSENTSKNLYSFGSVVATRVFASKEYRYGFNGMEKDDALNGNGNAYDFGARIYDGRLGKWFSLDPLMNAYPFFSAYSFALNAPLRFTDFKGRKIWDPVLDEEVIITYDQNNNPSFKTASGKEVSEKFMADAAPFLTTLSSSETGRNVIKRYQEVSTRVVIDPNDETNKANGGNSSWRPTNEGKRNEDGLFYEIIVSPFNDKIKKNAEKSKVAYEEKLIQVMAVEIGHVETKERVDMYFKYLKVDILDPKNAKVFAIIYNGLINDAIKQGVNYRNEKEGLEVDLTSFTPYYALAATKLGAFLKLDDDNEKLLEKVKAALAEEDDDE